jgi:hypothetical protein
MGAKEQFLEIKNCKYSKDMKYDHKIQSYLLKNIKLIEDNRETFTFQNLNEASKYKNVSGVYIIYLVTDGRVKFTYIGETDNIYTRWRQHANNISVGRESLYRKIRAKIKSSKELIYEIKFAVLEFDLDDLNRRLHRETYNIFKYKSRFYSLNSKNCSRRLHCPHGNHGACRVHLSYKVLPDDKCKIVLFGKSINKECNLTFVIG